MYVQGWMAGHKTWKLLYIFYAEMSLYVRFIDFQSTMQRRWSQRRRRQWRPSIYVCRSRAHAIAPNNDGTLNEMRNCEKRGNYSISVIFPLERNVNGLKLRV